MLALAEKEGLDAVFGSRLLNRKNESKWKILRERPFYLGTIITTFFINLFYGKNFTDIIGIRFYRAQAFKKINPQYLNELGFEKAFIFLWHSDKNEFVLKSALGYTQEEANLINTHINANKERCLNLIAVDKTLSSLSTLDNFINKNTLYNIL